MAARGLSLERIAEVLRRAELTNARLDELRARGVDLHAAFDAATRDRVVDARFAQDASALLDRLTEVRSLREHVVALARTLAPRLPEELANPGRRVRRSPA